MGYRFFLGLLVIFLLAGNLADAQPRAGKGKDKTFAGRNKNDKKQSEVVSEKFRAGAGFFAGFPLSDFSKDAYTGYGVSIDGEYFLNPSLSVGLNTGYHSYKYDEIFIGLGHLSMIPVLIRGAYYFKEGDFHPWAGLNAGIFLLHSKYDSIIEPYSYIDPITQLFVHKPGEIKPINENTTALGLVPMAGIVYKVSDVVWINCHLRYNLIFEEKKNKSSLGIHLGFAYSIGM